MSFSSLIYTDNYFFTTLDLWILVNKYKIPTIFISQKFILQTDYERNCFIGYGDEKDEFAFILLPGFRAEEIPGLKLIQTDNNEIFISIDKLNKECVNKIEEAIRNKISIEDYLISFTKKTKSKYAKKKPIKLIIVGDEEVSPKSPTPIEEEVIKHVPEEKAPKKIKKVKQPLKLIIVGDEIESEEKEPEEKEPEEKAIENPPEKKKRKTKKQKIILKGNNNKTKKNT